MLNVYTIAALLLVFSHSHDKKKKGNQEVYKVEKFSWSRNTLCVFCFCLLLLVSGQMVACEVEELSAGMKVCLKRF